MLRFNANLFRLAFSCSSNEETRFYMKGVYVEPHAQGGVTLTATDGHRLICIRDESGAADESAIINLGDGIKACKPKSGETRFVIVEGADAKITAEIDGTTGSLAIAMAYGVRVDGSFPDYRRVVPQAFSDKGAPGFQGTYLSDFSKLACELAAHAGYKPSKVDKTQNRMDSIRVLCADDKHPETCPALIQFPSIDFAFGVLMPVRLPERLKAATLDWFRAPAPMLQAAE